MPAPRQRLKAIFLGLCLLLWGNPGAEAVEAYRFPSGKIPNTPLKADKSLKTQKLKKERWSWVAPYRVGRHDFPMRYNKRSASSQRISRK